MIAGGRALPHIISPNMNTASQRYSDLIQSRRASLCIEQEHSSAVIGPKWQIEIPTSPAALGKALP
jgi:hypothetical protein